MKALVAALMLAGAAAVAAPASAADEAAATATATVMPTLTVTGAQSPFTRAERSVPAQLSVAARDNYRRIFAAIDKGRVSAARKALAAMPRGILHSSAEAQILLREGTRAGLKRLLSWLEGNGAAPEAPAIAALARKAGATSLPPLASMKQLLPVRLTPPLAPRSAASASDLDRAFAASARAAVTADRPTDVEAMLGDAAGLSADVASEWAERASWNAYLGQDGVTAARLGLRAAQGTSEWAAMGFWVAGLAAFRDGDCKAAAARFDAIDGVYTAPPELRSKAAYWAARSYVRCGQPWQSTARLKAAMERKPDGFYGLLAAEALGQTPRFDWREPDFIQADWTTLKNYPGARRAAALVEIGEPGLADRELRRLAAATANDSYEPILRLAARLDLPATQYWLAQNPPPGMLPPMSARFPTPDWTPLRGWRIEKSLIFAHALQESKFITGAKSGAGAKGVMQLMPGTARDVARAIDVEHRDDLLADPAYNVEYGQAYLEMLRDAPQTGGLLPKVIAAYNAGPGALSKWKDNGMRDNDDVLLFLESIPYLETRHYTEVVLRNLWLYELKERARDEAAPGAQSSLLMVAENRWPTMAAVATRGAASDTAALNAASLHAANAAATNATRAR